MRREFGTAIENLCDVNEKLVFLTGDLGYMALEPIQEKLGKRFINCGVAEQNMIGVAAGLAKQGFIPLVYSIAPFVTYRCLEQIRNDIAFHNLPVIIVGNGGGYGYGIMGSTHHAIEDYAVINAVNIDAYVPMFNEDLKSTIDLIMQKKKPAYLRLGYGVKPDNFEVAEFSEYRKLTSGNKLTILSIGPVGINAITDFGGNVEHWVIGKLPIVEIPVELINSINETKNLLCIEEHVEVGGLAEQFTAKLLEMGVNDFKFKRVTAQRYPNEKYGSQKYHQTVSGLDKENITKIISEFVG